MDYLTTAPDAGEILTGVRVPELGPDWGYRYEKFHRTAQSWATVGVAALARHSNGHGAEARIGLPNMGPVPVRASAAVSAAAGAEASVGALRAAADGAAEGTQPPADLHGAPDYRRHLARVLTGRALAAAAGVRQMELTHSFTVPVPLDQAWDVLLDVEKVAPCMPGATLDSVTGDEITGKIKVKVGPISMTYAGKAKFTERDREAAVVQLEASGKETRGAGTASATVRSELSGQGDETHVTVLTNLNVTGKPAQFGRGVLSEVAGRLIGIFADNLAKMLAAEPPAGAADAAEAADAVTMPAQTAPIVRPGLAEPIEELNLPLRVYNSLRREGVHTVSDLVAQTPQQLLAIDNIGRASVEDIRQRLASRGLSLSEAPAPQEAPAAGAEAAAEAPDLTAPTPLRSVPTAPADQAKPSWYADDDDAIDLLSVAGLPVLKRAIPVAAGVVVVAVVVVSVRRVRRRSRD